MNKWHPILLLIFFVVLNTSVKANPYIDSLKTVSKFAKSDTLKYDAFRKLGRAYIDSSYSNSLLYFREALKVATKLRDREKIAHVYHQIGAVYFKKGEFNEAVLEYKNALSVFEYLNNIKGTANVYNDIGLVYKTIGKYEMAINSYSIALSKYEQLNEEEGIGVVSNNIGQIYFYRDEYPKAIQYFTKFLNVSKTLNRSFDVAGASNNIAAAYMELKQYTKAYGYYQNALSVYDSLNIKLGVAILNDNIGSLFAKTDKYDIALDHHLIALSVFKNLNSRPRMAYTLKNIGFVYLKLGNYKIAIDYLTQSQNLALEYSQLETLKEVYYFLDETFQAQKNYKDALTNYKLFVQVRDTLLNQQTKEKLNTLEIQNESDRKTRELTFLQTKLKQQHVFNITTASIGFIFLFLLVLFGWDNYRKRSKVNKLSIQKQILVSELNDLIVENDYKDQLPCPYNIHILHNSHCNTNKLNFLKVHTDKYSALISIAFRESFPEIVILSTQIKKQIFKLLKSDTFPSSQKILLECERLTEDFRLVFAIKSKPEYNVILFDNNSKTIYPLVQNSGWFFSNNEVIPLSKSNFRGEGLGFSDSESLVLLIHDSNNNLSASGIHQYIENTVLSAKDTGFLNQIEVLKSSSEFWVGSLKNDQDFILLAIN
jgi:tetratricopeptide (TPR) repeat protein